jgi:hypothetical protein
MHFQFNPEAKVAFDSAGCCGYVYTHAASRITCLSMRTMRHYAQTGVIPAIRRGRRCWMFRVADLATFNEQRAFERRFDCAPQPEDSLRVL